MIEENINELIRVYLQHCQLEKRLSPKTIKAYRIDLSQFSNYLGCNIYVYDKAAIQNYLSLLHSQYKVKSVKRKIASLKAFFTYLVGEEIIPSRRFGTHLIGYANEYIAKQGIKDISKYLIIKPFVGIDKGAAQGKKRAREKVIGQCGATIFVFGENDGNAVSVPSGVYEEFEIARMQHKAIIPIAYPGMVSEVLWKEVKNNISKYPYLEKYIDLLTSEQSPDVLAHYIIQILDSIQEAMQL